ncbi:hypothetical protein P4O66_018375, partial [Electrophorus voltai]
MKLTVSQMLTTTLKDNYFQQEILMEFTIDMVTYSTTARSSEVLEKKLREVFTERTGILRQLSKTSKELDSIKGNLQSLKNDDSVPKKDVQRILELSHKQRYTEFHHFAHSSPHQGYPYTASVLKNLAVEEVRLLASWQQSRSIRGQP